MWNLEEYKVPGKQDLPHLANGSIFRAGAVGVCDNIMRGCCWIREGVICRGQKRFFNCSQEMGHRTVVFFLGGSTCLAIGRYRVLR